MIGAIVLVRAEVPRQDLVPEDGAAGEPVMAIAEPPVDGERGLVATGRAES
jgi:hypothetical protein